MILATDVDYEESTATAAGVLFKDWNAKEPEQDLTCHIEKIAPYESGSFYKRELPCIIALLNQHKLKVTCIVVDGYVFLGDQSQPGLGKHLYDALNGQVPVIGVAKNAFPGISEEHTIYRGGSKNPLYVTATGNLATAKKNVLGMHGKFRLPTLLKRVDQLCRGR